MPLINLTPHEVVLFDPEPAVRLPADNHLGHIVDTAVDIVRIADVPVAVQRRRLGTVSNGLPSLRESVLSPPPQTPHHKTQAIAQDETIKRLVNGQLVVVVR